MAIDQRAQTNHFRELFRGRTIKLNDKWEPVMTKEGQHERYLNFPFSRCALALILENIGEFIIE